MSGLQIRELVASAKAEIAQAVDDEVASSIAEDYLNSEDGLLGKELCGLHPIYIIKDLHAAMDEVEAALMVWSFRTLGWLPS